LKHSQPVQIVEQRLAKEWNSIRQSTAQQPRIRHFAGDPFWLRELLMAEYANPTGSTSGKLDLIVNRINENLVLNESLRQENESLRQENESLRQENESLRQENESLRQENMAVLNSRIWRFMAFLRFTRTRARLFLRSSLRNRSSP
jgi:FtsZ-binding cell division protein ZapB